MAKQHVYSLRVADSDRKRWQVSAKADGRKLSAFITRVMNWYCAGRKGKGRK